MRPATLTVSAGAQHELGGSRTLPAAVAVGDVCSGPTRTAARAAWGKSSRSTRINGDVFNVLMPGQEEVECLVHELSRARPVSATAARWWFMRSARTVA